MKENKKVKKKENKKNENDQEKKIENSLSTKKVIFTKTRLRDIEKRRKEMENEN